MLFRLIALFVIVPFVELTLLMMLAEREGWLFTVGLVVVTGIVGAALAKHEGLRCLRNVQEKLNQGQIPTDSLLDGLMILVAGALLLTPGILTDLVGFGLLTPPIRRQVRRILAARFKANIVVHQPGAPPAEADDIIDVEYRSTEDRTPPT